MSSVGNGVYRDDTPRRDPRRWKIVALLCLFSLVSYLERMNISVAGHSMAEALHLSKIQMGQIFSAFMLGYALFQIPAGALGDRRGPKVVLTVSALLWGIITICTGSLSGLVSAGGALVLLMALRFLLGATEASTYPVAARAIANWMTPEERGLSNSIVVGGLSLGSAITPPIVSWILLKAGWKACFYLSAIPAFLVAGIWYWYASDQPSSAPSQVRATEHVETPWKKLFTSRDLMLLSVSYFFDGYTVFIFVFWFYTYLVEVRGFSILSGGIFASMPFIASSVLTPIGGALTDAFTRRFGRRWGRRVPAMIGLFCSAAWLFFGAAARNPYYAVAGLSLSVGFIQFAEGSFWSTSVDIAGRHSGAASGFMNMLGNAGGAVSTALVPILVHHWGWIATLSTGSALSVIGGVLWLGIRPDQELDAVSELGIPKPQAAAS
jgi:ACS family glucarate transporter-like MFS transporter